MAKQAVDPYASFRELTLRGYSRRVDYGDFYGIQCILGLKVGLTFASSIPAAVISMAVWKFLKAAIFWKIIWCRLRLRRGYALQYYFYLAGFADGRLLGGFPFWQTTLLCMSGGILGVIFTVPLRYAMVVKSDLPYPEGVAAAEILKVWRP